MESSPLHLLTLAELARPIHAGASPAALRGWSDAYTLEQLHAIANHPNFDTWPSFDQLAILSALDGAEDEPESRT